MRCRSKKTLVWAYAPCFTWGCTVAPPDKYDGSISAAAVMRCVATITETTFTTDHSQYRYDQRHIKKCKQSRQTFGCQTNVPYRCQTTTAPARIVTREIKPTILPRKVRNPAQNYTRNPKLFPSQSACTQTSTAPIQDGWRTLCDDVTSRWNAAAENQGCARLNERRLEMVCTKFSIKWMVYWTK